MSWIVQGKNIFGGANPAGNYEGWDFQTALWGKNDRLLFCGTETETMESLKRDLTGYLIMVVEVSVGKFKIFGEYFLHCLPFQSFFRGAQFDIWEFWGLCSLDKIFGVWLPPSVCHPLPWTWTKQGPKSDPDVPPIHWHAAAQKELALSKFFLPFDKEHVPGCFSSLSWI